MILSENRFPLLRDHALKTRSGIHDRLAPQAAYAVRCRMRRLSGLKRRASSAIGASADALRRKGHNDLGAEFVGPQSKRAPWCSNQAFLQSAIQVPAPCSTAVDRVQCLAERPEHDGISSSAMPEPLSLTLTTGSGPSDFQPESPRPLWCEFDPIRRQIRERSGARHARRPDSRHTLFEHFMDGDVVGWRPAASAGDAVSDDVDHRDTASSLSS